MEVDVTGKRNKDRPRKSWEEYVKKDLEQYDLRGEAAYNQKKWQEQIEAKIANPDQPE